LVDRARSKQYAHLYDSSVQQPAFLLASSAHEMPFGRPGRETADRAIATPAAGDGEVAQQLTHWAVYADLRRTLASVALRKRAWRRRCGGLRSSQDTA
jgi:hypothetical protein